MLAFFSCASSSGDGKYETLSPSQFKEAIAKSGVLLVDVRTAAEFDEGHLPNAINVDVKSPSFKDDALKLLSDNEGATIAVYCRSGMRSAKAASLFADMGCRKIINLDGGILAWIEAGGAVTTAE